MEDLNGRYPFVAIAIDIGEWPTGAAEDVMYKIKHVSNQYVLPVFERVPADQVAFTEWSYSDGTVSNPNISCLSLGGHAAMHINRDIAHDPTTHQPVLTVKRLSHVGHSN